MFHPAVSSYSTPISIVRPRIPQKRTRFKVLWIVLELRLAEGQHAFCSLIHCYSALWRSTSFFTVKVLVYIIIRVSCIMPYFEQDYRTRI